MDIYEILVFFVLLPVFIVEMTFNYTWNNFYFRAGIPIFRHEIKHTVTTPLLYGTNEIEKAIPNSIFVPIRILKLSDNEFAFRESFFWGIIRFSYPPIMHGIMRVTPSGNIRIVGLLNYFPIFFCILFISFAISESPHYDILYIIIPLSFLFAFWALIYFIQYKRFRAVANAIESLYTPSH